MRDQKREWREKWETRREMKYFLFQKASLSETKNDKRPNPKTDHSWTVFLHFLWFCVIAKLWWVYSYSNMSQNIDMRAKTLNCIVYITKNIMMQNKLCCPPPFTNIRTSQALFKYCCHILCLPKIHSSYISLYRIPLHTSVWVQGCFYEVKQTCFTAEDEAILSPFINGRQFKGQAVAWPSLCGRVCCRCSLA